MTKKHSLFKKALSVPLIIATIGLFGGNLTGCGRVNNLRENNKYSIEAPVLPGDSKKSNLEEKATEDYDYKPEVKKQPDRKEEVISNKAGQSWFSFYSHTGSLDYAGYDNWRFWSPGIEAGTYLMKGLGIGIRHTLKDSGREDGYDFNRDITSVFARFDIATSCKSKEEEKVQLYALLGFIRLKIEFPKAIPSNPVVNEELKASNKEDGIFYGAGLEVDMPKSWKNWRFAIEYNNKNNSQYSNYSWFNVKVKKKF